MTRQYHMIHAPVMAFFSRAFYRDVARRWAGIGLIYLVLLLAITWAVVIGRVYAQMKTFLATDGQQIIAQVPAISIINGVVSTDAVEPYTITDPQTGQPLAVIDTTGQITSLSQTGGAQALLTDTELIVQGSGSQTRHHDLSEVKQLDLDAAKLQGWADRFSGPLLLGGAVAATVFSIGYRLVLALIVGGVLLAITNSMKKPITLAGGMRVAVMAMTPPVLLSTLLDLTGVTPYLGCMGWLLTWGVFIGYLCLAVISLNSDEGDAGVQPAMQTGQAPAPPSEPWQ